MKLEHFIALRYILAGRKNRDISAASLTVIAVIAVAIIFFISSVSIMNGYIYGIMKIAFEIKSFHIDYPGELSIGRARETADFFNADKKIKIAYPYLESRALLSSKTRNTGIAIFRAVPQKIFKDDVGLSQTVRLLDGKLDLSRNSILISKKTAQKLNSGPGDSIYITVMQEGSKAKLSFRRLKISGLFTTGFIELDEQLAYVSLSTGSKIFDNDNSFSVAVKLYDHLQAEDTALWYTMAGYNGLVTWEEANYNELTALKFERNIIAFIVSLVVLVASLNILITIYMMVMEKKQDIGILKALGYSPRHITSIFLFTGIYLGSIGVIIGVVTGILVQKWLNELLLLLAGAVNIFRQSVWMVSTLFVQSDCPHPIQLFPKDFYLEKIYTDITFPQIMLIASLTMLFSIIASIAPAIRASIVKPNEVIKNG